MYNLGHQLKNKHFTNLQEFTGKFFSLKKEEKPDKYKTNHSVVL